MNRKDANHICAGFSGASLAHSFGPETEVWKIGGKIFALVGAANRGVSLKCVDAATAALLIDLGVAEKAPYLPRGGWIFLSWDSTEAVEFQDRLAESYTTVLKSLTKKHQAEIVTQSAG